MNYVVQIRFFIDFTEKWSAPQKLDRLVNLNIELGIAPGLILLNQV